MESVVSQIISCSDDDALCQRLFDRHHWELAVLLQWIIK